MKHPSYGLYAVARRTQTDAHVAELQRQVVDFEKRLIEAKEKISELQGEAPHLL